jgi:hypothetical protein
MTSWSMNAGCGYHKSILFSFCSEADVVGRDAALVTHRPEDSVRHPEQVGRRVGLDNLAGVKHADPVVSNDRSQAVCASH